MEIVEILKALLTPTIAGVTVYIAYQQWRTNKYKIKIDHYDRRLQVYEEVKRALSIIARDADISINDLLRFRTSTSAADFLFGPEISEYMNEIYTRGLNLRTWNQQYRDYLQAKPNGYDHTSIVNGQSKELEWLIHQFEPAKQIFKRYLDISK
jgi:hypothetical protein